VLITKTDIKTELRRILERHQGRDQAVTGMELAKRLGHRNDREIRQVIRELIAEGLPVASCGAGYFLATSYAEAREYADSLKGRLIEDALRRRDFRRAADCHLRLATQRRLI